MKKFSLLLSALVLLTGLFLITAFAADPIPVQVYDEAARSYGQEIQAGTVGVTFNGKKLDLDVPAILLSVDGADSRTMVPVRPLAEALGAAVLWLGENRQVLLLGQEGETIVLTLGSARAVVNGSATLLPGMVPAQVVRYGEGERTMVPLRFLSEGLGAEVEWDGAANTVKVTTSQTVLVESLTGKLLRVTADSRAGTVTLLTDAAPRYQITDLGDRVVIDLPGFSIGSGKDGSLTVDGEIIRSVRYAFHQEDNLIPGYSYVTRVVVDLLPGCTLDEDLTITPTSSGITVSAGQVKRTQLGDGGPVWVRPRDWKVGAPTVCLDPGHGGSASGATYEGYKEKNLTLPITLRVAELLKARGCNVVLTREGDKFVDLYRRSDIANAADADIFVSVHCNASASNRTYEGTFTYFYPGSEKGEKLAGMVQDAVIRSAGSVDRGLLSNNYVVLRETWMPAVLVETGFMSAHGELSKLVTPSYQEKLAQGIAKGIEAYLKSIGKLKK